MKAAKNRIITQDAWYLIRLYIQPDEEKAFVEAVWRHMQEERIKEKEMVKELVRKRKRRKGRKKKKRVKKIFLRKDWHKMTRFDVESFIDSICPDSTTFSEKKKILQEKFSGA